MRTTPVLRSSATAERGHHALRAAVLGAAEAVPGASILRLDGPVLMIAAHPDDEVIGAGAQLPGWEDIGFVHVTDGAPQDMRDARASGCKDREGYARARRRELASALALAGLEAARLHELGLADQEVSWHLPELARALRELIWEEHPAVVVTHPYEGGHPDHDATAFGVHAACRLLHAQTGLTVPILEMTSYHNSAGEMATGDFLSHPSSPVTTLQLSEQQREFKRQLFNCFATQRAVLAAFSIEWERFRPAPAYDFTRPAHEGTLFYELFEWGMTGQRWRSLAKEALRQLGLAP